MRIRILGGGPAGLYLAILLKRRDASHEVIVHERNAHDDTFGWGVVFSDETLGHFAAADPESYAAITRDFARWDALDIHVKGETYRSHGHGFCGIARKRLLILLAERARELGVELHFKDEVADVDALRDGVDLLVGADGLRSVVRQRFEEHFRPSIELRKARFIWLGTHASFEAFTFSFRQSEHGLFQIHAYQFEAPRPGHQGLSTVIVETDEDTWRAAGLHEASEAQSIAYCEKVFAEDLGGAKLLPNRSSWIQFPTVKNETWVHDNVVLIGDAAHTAHFSIGSGTKLAMEDAILLAEALAAHPDDVAAGLAEYQERRGPEVARIQRAAQPSLEWFEDTKRHYDALAPIQLAYSLLTRSKRITHANLKLRDPELVARTEAFFAERAGVPADAPPTPPMFTPFQLRELTLPNRVVVSPMCMYSAEDGVPDDWHMVHLGSRAVGGAGLVMTEMTDVSAEGRISPGCTGLWNETQRDAWKRICEFVHTRTASKIGIQLGHAGRKGSTRLLWEGHEVPLREGNWPVMAPSALAHDPGKNMQVPREMTRADMDAVKAEFVRATELAAEAGFDLVEVHFAHGYLLSSFLTPLANQRRDEYGGSLDNRLRYPLEVFDAMRAVWPNERPMSVRVSATDWVPGGFDADDAVAVARVLQEHGCDIIDVSTGQTSPEAEPIFGRMYQTPFAERIRNEVGIPTIAVGAIQGFDHVNTIVLAGRADLCALARPHLYDPYVTLHAAHEQGYDAMEWPPQYVAAPSAAPKKTET